MLRSLFSGVSGMKNNQIKMDVIGNNIANVSTTAFKAGRVRFQDILSQTVKNAQSPTLDGRGGINPRQVGLGMQVAGIDTITNQGAPQPTGRPLDCAIDGEGYFALNNGTKTVYSRDGAFGFDSDNNLINSDGYRVMGYLPTTATMKILYNDDLSNNSGLNWSDVSGSSTLKRASDLTIAGPIGIHNFVFAAPLQTLSSIAKGTGLIGTDIDFSTASDIQLGDSQTSLKTVTLTKVTALGNITDATSSDLDKIVSALQGDIDSAGLGADYKVSKSGNSLNITSSGAVGATSVSFGTGADIFGFTDSTDNIGVIGTINEQASATGVTASLKDGKLVLQSTFDINDRANAANVITVSGTGDFEGLSSEDNVSAGDAIIDDSSFTDMSTLKSLSIPLNHPLKAGVKLNNFSIEANGTIKGVYDDGSVMALGKIATAKFINPGGLVKMGSNNYGVSANSGDPQVGEPGSNGSGEVLQSTLEMSNVDMASEFTDMIITSRAFQANSRTITTSDEMLQELLNLKR